MINSNKTYPSMLLQSLPNHWVILLLFIGTAACRESSNAAENHGPAETVSPKKINHQFAIPVDTKQSFITWKGSMLVGTSSHTGYVYLSNGALMLKNRVLAAGEVEVDMTTIQDESHRADNNLIEHLKNADFFDVEQFPLAGFKISSVVSLDAVNQSIAGDLTIKGITKPISFPARVEVNDDKVKADGRLKIDRTEWDVRYKSGKFFPLLADQTMSDSIELHFHIVAHK